MQAITYTQAKGRWIELLERHGWELQRVQGSHHIYAKPGRLERISLPIHGSPPLKTGLQRHLMKLAEIDESDLQ